MNLKNYFCIWRIKRT